VKVKNRCYKFKIAALVMATMLACASFAYSVPQTCLRLPSGFSSDKEQEMAQRFSEASGVAVRVLEKHFSGTKTVKLEQLLEKLCSEEEFKDEPGKVHSAIHGLLQIYCDISGTIADHPAGSHEEKLAQIVSQDDKVVSFGEREKFLTTCKEGHERFGQIRRNQDISIGERYMAWLAPLKGKLHERHIKQLVEDWKFKDEFLQGPRLVRKYLPGDYPIVMTAESGALVNMIRAFIETKAEKMLESENIVMLYDGVELVMDENGYFQGEIRVNGKLFHANAYEYPEDSLVIGDDPMENYGFGKNSPKSGEKGRDILLNVQTFSQQDAERVVGTWYKKKESILPSIIDSLIKQASMRTFL